MKHEGPGHGNHIPPVYKLFAKVSVLLVTGIDYSEMVIVEVKSPNDGFADYNDCHLVSM